eukprot:CAMPEP_0115136392 /NCGR_PEP_ID=MMETSP0227-20121206/56356_1 /TAXON_ID=89957 /ORGANISM="Polarella glacialis, Strain CCMP 1383" /LENGTH=38 /DNA_ID= /DNA_START= /DNA_END= /DNA_ORIENTATION=
MPGGPGAVHAGAHEGLPDVDILTPSGSFCARVIKHLRS